MALHRFFAEGPMPAEGTIPLGPGALHHLRDVLRLDDGSEIIVVNAGVAVRVRLTAVGASLNKIYSHIRKLSDGKSVWNYIILHAHNPEGARQAGEKMAEITGMKPVSVVNISPVIGMHAGNGAIAVSLMFNS